MNNNRLRIKEAIKERNLTINEVANRMNISRFTLSSHINGNPSIDIINRIADAIGCEIVDLIEHKQNDETTIKCPNCGTNIKIKVEK